jgi:hypothetical protein
MQRHMETINRLQSAGKSLQQDMDNLITLFHVYDTLPLRPNGILEGENWDAVDPMKPLGQPVANALCALITRTISLDSTIAGKGDLIWFDTKMEISFIFPLASLIHISTIMFTYRTALHLQNAHRSTGMCCLQVSLQFPIRMLLQSNRQEASFSLINCLGKTISFNYVTTVCQLLCQRATHTA